jgi:hypothetical protein
MSQNIDTIIIHYYDLERFLHEILNLCKSLMLNYGILSTKEYHIMCFSLHEFLCEVAGVWKSKER